jgi:ATP-dependent Lon protease
VTVPKLFVNNSSGKIGLVGYWDCVAFDEFAGTDKRVDKALVDIMKNYMANKTFSRGVETLGAEASMVFVGNTKHNVPYMLKNTDLFDELPKQYYDPAFIDRLHAYIPGWEIEVIRAEMFSGGYGFVVDYLAEILRHMRGDDFSNRYQSLFTLSSAVSTRDRDGVHKSFSGLMKLLFPSGEATEAEVEEILKLAIEGRKRVKDQLMRIDSTYPDVDFSFAKPGGAKVTVSTLEEAEYPAFYFRGARPGPAQPELKLPDVVEPRLTPTVQAPVAATPSGPKEGHRVFAENQKGINFDALFGPYIRGARRLIVTDPYIRLFYQARNLMEFIEMVARQKSPDEEVEIHLITSPDEAGVEKQQAHFVSIEAACAAAGMSFSWEFDGTGTIHARHIVTDTGWKILLDRGLDVFQRYDMKAFEVTYVRLTARH